MPSERGEACERLRHTGAEPAQARLSGSRAGLEAFEQTRPAAPRALKRAPHAERLEFPALERDLESRSHAEARERVRTRGSTPAAWEKARASAELRLDIGTERNG